MSSAKSTMELEGRTEGWSFINTEKRVGLRVELCETPLVGKQREEYVQCEVDDKVREVRLKPGNCGRRLT